MNYLTLFLTEKCNKKCFYCDVGNLKKQKQTDESLIWKFIPMIEMSDWQYVVLTGGEPALAPPEVLKYTIESLGHKHIRVNTNGLWFKMGYYDKYKSLVNEIQYHPVTELNEDFDIIEGENIVYNFPVHKKNIIHLESFLKKYYDIPIMLTPYDNKIGDDSYELSMLDSREIYEIIQYKKNVVNDTIQLFRFLGYIAYPEAIRDFCTNSIVAYPSIDFVNGRIKKCIKSHTRSDYKPLTRENFKNLRNLSYHHNEICDNCMLFVRNFMQIIREMIK